MRTALSCSHSSGRLQIGQQAASLPHIVLFLFLFPLTAQVGRNRPVGAEPPTFQTSTQLVIETVTIKDKDGKPIEGLTAKDFTLTEDGVPRTISFFEHQQLATNAQPAPLPGTVRPGALTRLSHAQITPEKPGDIHHRDRRLLALYFDLRAMPPPDQVRALKAAERFIRTSMSASDLVAVMAFRSGAVEIFQDFTDDREKLLSVIETLIVGEDENAPPDPSTQADSGAAFGQNDSEFNIFFTDRQLAALQTAASTLGRLSEKKSLIYFASGLRLNGTNNLAQLHATINAAIRAGVSFWPVDARGLVAQAPLGDATTGSPGGAGMYTGATANAVTGALQRSQDTLWTLAADTGGKALLDSNDLEQGIIQAQRATSSYYILGYYTTNANPDGKFRKIKISLVNELRASIDYRQGYYAPKVFAKFATADKERQLEEALMLADPITELTIALEVGYFQLNSAEYFTAVTVKIPGSELVLARKRGAEHTVIDFVAEIKDDYGMTQTNLRDKVDAKLTDTTAAELAGRPIEYHTAFTLLPGKYRIKFLARDAETGRIGTFELPFTIPNLNREAQRIPISSVVLSSQRVALRDALFTAGKQKNQQQILASPLVQDGQELIHSVTRVFSKTKEMNVFLQAYGRQSVFAYVSLYRDGRKIFESRPGLWPSQGERLKTSAIRLTVPLSSLDPGEYVCQVSVIDPVTKKAAFWRAPVMIVP